VREQGTKYSTHRDATIMDNPSSRVFIQINNIFVDILHDKLIGLFGHPGMNKSKKENFDFFKHTIDPAPSL
jgi:hypothetical protein